MKKTLLVSLIAAACSNAHAIDPFTPLNAPATALNTNEATKPFLLPSGWTATKVTDRNTLNSQAGFQASFGNWDMIDIGGANNEFVYIPMSVTRMKYRVVRIPRMIEIYRRHTVSVMRA